MQNLDSDSLVLVAIDLLLLSTRVGIGRDVALVIGRFLTSGICESDRMETMLKVRARYGF